MTYLMNDIRDWDEYYHEDNFRPDTEVYRYLRQTRDGKWWYAFMVINTMEADGDWVELPEAATLEEAAAATDMLWRMK